MSGLINKISAGLISMAALLFISSSLDASTVDMDDMVVSGERIDEADRNDFTAFKTVIESSVFENRSKSFSEVIEETVGLNVKKFGGDGSWSTASIRGSSASQVTILIDGVPLNRGKSGVVNLGNISLANVDRIEIYRGTSPLRFRSSSIGGVINIVTKKNHGDSESSVSATYGSFNTFDVKMCNSGAPGRNHYLFSADISGTDGDFKFYDDNGTPVNYADDETVKRKNNDYLLYNIFGRFGRDFSDELSFDTSLDYFDKTEGVPGVNSNQSDHASLDTKRTILNSNLKKENIFSNGTDANITLWALNEETWFNDAHGEIGTGSQKNHSKNIAAGLDTALTFYAWDHHYMTVILSGQHEYYDAEDNLTSAGNKNGDSQQRSLYQLGFSDDISFFDSRMTLSPQILYSYLVNDFGGAVSFISKEISQVDNEDYLTVKAGWELILNNNLKLKANLGRYYRYPNFSELFGDEGTIIGNPELNPEKGLNADIGLNFRFRNKTGLFRSLLIETVIFNNRVDDLILFEQTSQRTVRASNISEAEILGLETIIELRMTGHFLLTGNMTFQDSENVSDISYYKGKQLPGVPEFESSVKAEVYSSKGRIFYEFNYMADNYLDAYNSYYVNDRKIHNAGIIVNAGKNASLTLEALNMTDNQTQDVLGFALPGRSFSGTIRIEF